MDLEIESASSFPLPDLVKILNQGFEGYLIPIRIEIVDFLNMLRKDGIDLTASHVLIMDQHVTGC
jgi:hypothetical protein